MSTASIPTNAVKMFVKAVFLLISMRCTCARFEDWNDFRQQRFNAEILAATSNSMSTTEKPPNEYCKKIGYQCQSCSTSIFCNREGNNWTVVDTFNCENGDTCNNGDCKSTPTRECLGDQIPSCKTNEGVFPDPSSCQKYYYCIPSDSGKLTIVQRQCDSGFSYNAHTKYCDKVLPQNTCNGYPVPDCSIPGQTAALTTNPSIYYTCLPVVHNNTRVLYPFLDACKNGKKYEASSRTCT